MRLGNAIHNDRRFLQFQSTHPLRGATLTTRAIGVALKFQSTHPLRGATIVRMHDMRAGVFQSTHPLRGATAAALMEVHQPRNFNPRTPCGVRRSLATRPASVFYFNPRTPCGVRPECCINILVFLTISIHAPLAGCDSRAPCRRCSTRYFNPRTPCGVRRWYRKNCQNCSRDFNPRTPCGVRRQQSDHSRPRP